IRQRDDVVGLEATIIMATQIWKASGHVDTFADLMRECPLTKKRVRADQVEPQSGTVYRFAGAARVVQNGDETVAKIQRIVGEFAPSITDEQSLLDNLAANWTQAASSNEIVRSQVRDALEYFRRDKIAVWEQFAVILQTGK